MSVSHLKTLFNRLSDDNVIKVENWNIGVPHTIINLQLIESKYGPCILATLSDDKEQVFKSYLPARFACVLDESEIIKINESPDKHYLVNEGKTTSGKSWRITFM